MTFNFSGLALLAPFFFAGLCAGLSACDSKPALTEATQVSPEALQAHSKEFKQEVLKAADGIYVAIGYGIANSILLEGTDGSIVVDTTESLDTGKKVAEAFRKVSTKPIKAIIYTHSHPDHVQGAAAFATNVPIYAHEEVSANMDKIASELQPVITRRSLQMYGWGLTEAERVNVGIGPEIDLHEGTELGIARPTKTFDKFLEDTVAGIHFELHHAIGETEDQIFVWLPERKILLPGDNIYKAFPNLYTIRGTSYRDPKKWMQSLDAMRRLKPVLLVPSHTRPITGEALVAQTLTDYRDAVAYTYQQSIRGMNLGLSPDDVAARLKLPAHLAKSPFLQEFYGNPRWSAKNIFAGNLGWFDGDPATLEPSPPLDRSQRYVALAGGEDKFNAQIKESKDPHWTLELTSHALRVNANNEVAKQARLAALKSLGEAASNPNARHWYLSQFHQLKGDLVIPSKIVQPTPTMLAAMPLSTFFDGLSVNLNAEKAGNNTQTVRFEFSDNQEQWTLIQRQGVVEVIPPGQPAPEADLIARVPAQVFKEMLAQVRNPASTLVSEFEMKKGSKLDFIQFMQLFVPEKT
jgi:alkyl sulfatase BDS1-like metallo-beta-lactamase superfamily hydrolase